MEPSTYSVFADLLAKFQSSPEWIKALWLVTVRGDGRRGEPVRGGCAEGADRRGAPRRSDPPLIDLPPPVEADAQWLASRNGELWLMRLPAPPLSPRGAAGEPGTHNRDDWE